MKDIYGVCMWANIRCAHNAIIPYCGRDCKLLTKTHFTLYIPELNWLARGWTADASGHKKGRRANPTELFKYLRDCMNGYAAALLHNPEREMPAECVTMSELRSMLSHLQRQDEEKVAKAAENASKRRKTKWANTFSLKWGFTGGHFL